jgi:ABC-type transport system involved in multi-copper enzyme maturation permease subunit
MALVGVELRRLMARRMVRVIGAALLVVLVATPLLADWAFDEQARIERDADLERCEQGREPKVRDGVTVPTIPASVGSPAERARQCRLAIPPRSGRFERADIGEVLRPYGVLLVLAGFAVGASAAGADWQSGYIATLLTWESRRRRVLLGKLTAVAMLAGVAILLWQIALSLALSAGVPLAMELRIAAVGCGAAALGHAAAFLGRGTAAALGAGIAWVGVLETVLSSYFKPLRPWLGLNNAIVFVKGQFEGGPAGDVPGRTVTAAALILLAYVGAVVAAALVSFARRDVA